MKIEQRKWSEKEGWISSEAKILSDANLVLAFGSRKAISMWENSDYLKKIYPSAEILLASTSGEILNSYVIEDSIVATAIFFEKTNIKISSVQIDSMKTSFEAGKKLSDSFTSEGLVHLFVLSDGQKVNGSQLVKGLVRNLPKNVSVTGGLAGDGTNFKKTVVGLNSIPHEGTIAAVGFYGENLQVGCGSMGGWDSFGPERLITRSNKNILYELDGQSALALYKKYLGDQAAGLPGTALLFPLSIRVNDEYEPVVRTILSVNENDQSLVFAGDMPEGAYARLMKANFERLIDGAASSAEKSLPLGNVSPDLAILISCVGRKLVLGQRIYEEVESVKKILGSNTVITGFYSYGEISPLGGPETCEFHNQTMTVTTFTEI
ncbi:MAG: FIST N-terminal domain-containing protein [Ignavibacteriaceae bacterium]